MTWISKSFFRKVPVHRSSEGVKACNEEIQIIGIGIKGGLPRYGPDTFIFLQFARIGSRRKRMKGDCALPEPSDQYLDIGCGKITDSPDAKFKEFRF